MAARDPSSWLEEFEHEMAVGNVAFARRLSHRALRADPHDSLALHAMAEVDIRQENWVAARRRLLQELACGSDDEGEARRRLGFVEEVVRDTTSRAWRGEDVDELLAKFEQVCGLQGGTGWSRLAAFLLERIREVAPGSTERWHAEGLIAQTREDWPLAEYGFRRALDLDPVSESSRYHLARALLSQQGYEEAAVHYRRFLEARPEVPPAWHNLGACLQAMGRGDEALKCWDRAITANPKYYMAWVAKAQVLREQGREEEARACWERAGELNPVYCLATIAASMTPTPAGASKFITHVSGMGGPGDEP